MPIYEYQCQECGEEFEKLVRFPSKQTECPHCGGKDVRKVISRFGFAMKEKDKGEWKGGPKM